MCKLEHPFFFSYLEHLESQLADKNTRYPKYLSLYMPVQDSPDFWLSKRPNFQEFQPINIPFLKVIFKT